MKIKKLIASVSLAAMLLPTIALGAESTPSEADRSDVTVYGVEKGSTVNAYHVVEATYNAYGLTGYKQTKETAGVEVIEDFENPTYEDIATLSNKILSDDEYAASLERIPLKWSDSAKGYVGSCEAGSYIVLVESESEGYVYNPMYVSNSYTNANNSSTLGGHTGNGSVTATEDVITLAGVKAYAKRSHTYFTKDIVNSSTGNSKVDDERVGDTVTFDLKTVTPDYSDAFLPGDIVFKVTDTQSDGLAVVKEENVKVYVGDAKTGTVIDKADYTLTVNADSNSFEVDFNKTWVLNNPTTKVTIRYSTIIDEDAVMALNSNPNTARLDYTTVYGEEDTITDKTRHYSFVVNFDKVDEDGNALSGATFELTQVLEGNVNGAGALTTPVVYTEISDEKGLVSFDGLEEGTYILKEIKAPDKYAVNDSVWEVKITPEYDHTANIIKSYTVGITETTGNGTVLPEKEFTYTVKTHSDAADSLSDTVTLTTDASVTDSLMEVTNLKLLALPSVGGNGTAALVVGAVVLMSIALTLTFIVKKEDK